MKAFVDSSTLLTVTSIFLTVSIYMRTNIQTKVSEFHNLSNTNRNQPDASKRARRLGYSLLVSLAPILFIDSLYSLILGRRVAKVFDTLTFSLIDMDEVLTFQISILIVFLIFLFYDAWLAFKTAKKIFKHSLFFDKS